MPKTVDGPALYDHATTGVAMGGAGVGVPAGHLSPARRHLQGFVTGRVVREQVVCVARVHRRVAISVEQDRWYGCVCVKEGGSRGFDRYKLVPGTEMRNCRSELFEL